MFGVAGKHGVDVDIHLHDMGTLGVFEIEQIAARTRALGMEGHVAVSHAYGLGDISTDHLKKIADILARSGVAIMTNAPGARAFPPILALRNAGVTVFSGNDNIRDFWWPYGDGDMLRRATTLGYRSGFNIDEELRVAFDVVTVSGAKALRLEGYGLRVGAKADFVTLNAEHIPEAVVGVPQGRCRYKEGMLVACDGTVCREARLMIGSFPFDYTASFPDPQSGRIPDRKYAHCTTGQGDHTKTRTDICVLRGSMECSAHSAASITIPFGPTRPPRWPSSD